MLLGASVFLASELQAVPVHAVQPRIVGGAPATLGEIPWQVGLYEQDGGQLVLVCGGTLIDAKWVTTAAHCFAEHQDIVVKAGVVDKTSLTGAQLVSVKRWIVHPGYQRNTLDNDIALLELNTPVDLIACGAACQAIDPVTSRHVEGTMGLANRGTISGWGNRTSGEFVFGNEDYPDLLEFADVQIVDCLAGTFYRKEDVTSNMFCAATPDYSRDACQGDSGGPLVVANPDGTPAPLLAGIVSWGGGCAVEGYPGVYTRVANYACWIGEQTGLACCQDEPSGPAHSAKKSSGALSVSLLTGLLALLWGRRRFRQRSASAV